MSLGQVPVALKAAKPYVKLALELYKKKPVVAYHCFSYSMRLGLKADYKSDAEAKAYLFKLMDHVESMQKALSENPDLVDSVKNDMDGQLAVESAASEYFDWADSEDRKSNFSASVVKAFYVANLLYGVLNIFNETMSEESKYKQKYAKWKVVYIKQCLAKGETPVPGPMGGDDEEEEGETGESFDQPTTSTQAPVAPPQQPFVPVNPQQPTSSAGEHQQKFPTAAPRVKPQEPPAPRVKPQEPPAPRVKPQEPAARPRETAAPAASNAAVSLSFADKAEAQKLCKFAGSALSYDDTTTAVNYLEKCLRLLTTGQR